VLLKTNLGLSCKWFVLGKEVGENGTPHIQGAAVLGKQTAFSTIKKIPGMVRAHIEVMHGTPHDSLVYCSKEDPAPFTFGTLPEPGKRNDLHDATLALKEGMSMRDLAVNHPTTVVKFFKGLTTFKTLIEPPRDVSEPPTVYWLYGSTGTGKTRRAYEFGHNVFPDFEPWACSNNLQWFDGYDGQSAVIFDDFRAKGISFPFLLRLLDRYPLRVPIKGGFVDWKPKLIFVTTPHAICTTFSKRAEHIPEDIEQLKRRVTASFDFDSPDDKAQFLDLLRDSDGELTPLPSPSISSSSSSEGDISMDEAIGRGLL